MKPLVDLLFLVLKSYPTMFLSPVVTVLYLVVLALVAGQYVKIQSLEEKMYGRSKNKAFGQTLKSIGLGFFGGLLASVLLVMVGVTVSDSGIGYLLPVALILYLFSPRFLCFSYAGSLASMSYMLFGWPEVNVPAMMALVACLHAAEALLIKMSGDGCTTPLYIEGKNGQVAGGFTLQRFWPIPLMVLYLHKIPDLAAVRGLIHLPDWWPLISVPAVPGPGTPVFVTMPLVAALGYGDLSLARTPKEKAARTAANLAVYSVLLLGLSIAASNLPAFSWVAVLFSAFGHEAVIKIGAKEELVPEPFFENTGDGVVVMDVFEGTSGFAAGLRPGDVILEAKGMPVKTREQLEEVLAETGPAMLKVGGLRRAGFRHLNVGGGREPLGIVTAPEPGDRPMASANAPGLLARWVKSFVKKPER